MNLTDAQINQTWAEMKEDFWAFNINVTTDLNAYNAAPSNRRIKCIFTSNNAAAPGSGGVAYRNSFSNTASGRTTKICWVFNNSTGSRACTGSHEVGHTLGLGHDGRVSPLEEYYSGHGTGVVGWGPLMGSPFSKNLSQWSKGEYTSASNTEDDLAIITRSTNGFGYIADDVGNTQPAAAPLAVATNTINQRGNIEQRTDVDFFAFSTTGGAVSIQAGVVADPNLDLAIDLLDGAGTVIGTSNSPTELGGTIAQTLTAGTYFIKISPTGRTGTDSVDTGYSSYGSLGEYIITGTIPGGAGGIAPTVGPITAQTMLEDGTLSLNLGFTDSDTPAAAVVLSATSANSALVPNTTAALAFAGTTNTRTLTIRPAANANGTSQITVTASDGGFTHSVTFTLTVNAVNDAPSFVKGSDQTVNEDIGARSITGWAGTISAGPSNESTQAVTFTVSNDNTTLFSTQPAVSSAGTLTFTPAVNAFGNATVTVSAADNGGTANTGVNTSLAQTFLISITPINDAPTIIAGATQTVLEDSGPRTVTGWATGISAGPANEVAQALTISAVAANPLLFAVQPQVATNGTLTFTPAPDASGSSSVAVDIMDDGGTANGGDNITTVTFTVTITAVNDPPSFTAGSDRVVLEDSGLQTVTGWATAISPGPASESTQTVTFSTTNTNTSLFSTAPAIAANGTLTFTPAANAFGTAVVTVTATDNGGTANGGVATSSQTFTITVTGINDAPSFTKGANQTVLEDSGQRQVIGWATAVSAGPNETAQLVNFVVTATNPQLFSEQPTVLANGRLSFTPALNANGTTNVDIRLADDGGTANGGIDSSALQTFTITITAVNDAPSFTKGADPSVVEDGGPAILPNFVSNVVAGPADESTQPVTFSISNNNATLFSTAPALDGNGALSFTAAPNAFGTATLTITATDTGGTANGGVATTAQTITITVLAVNDAPSFVKGGDQTVLEESGARTVTAWATAISPGPANESTQTVSFVVSTDRPEIFSAQPAVSPAGVLTFTPAANRSGVAIVTLLIADNGPTANGGQNVSAVQTFTISIMGVNDAPGFTKGSDVSVAEDAGLTVLNGWATNIQPGSPDESAQILSFTIANTNPGLFSTQPSLTPSGVLSFMSAPDVYGTATISLTLRDDGGTANGGLDTSSTQTFTITILPANDPPSFTAGPDQVLREDSGPQTIAGWASGFAVGPANESGQAQIEFIVSVSRPSLFASVPTVSLNGTLTFTPAADANGEATVNVRLRDDGGTANGGIDTSAPQAFTIRVTPVNDQPVFVKGPDQIVDEDPGQVRVTSWASSISPGAPDESQQVLTFAVVNSNPGLFASGPSIAADGTLTFTPAGKLVRLRHNHRPGSRRRRHE
jgi:VCBS repeat-containing protein